MENYIDSGMRTLYQRRLTKGFNLKFFEDYTSRQSTDTERSIHRLKYCDKNECISLTVNNKIV